MKQIVLLLLLLAFGVGAALAEGPDMNWSVIAAGGSTPASDGIYRLRATLGQGACGMAYDGEYSLQAGFWHIWGALAPPQERYAVYLPLVLRNR